MLELVGPDGTVGVHKVGGRAAVAEYAPRMIGLTLAEGKHLLAAYNQADTERHKVRTDFHREKFTARSAKALLCQAGNNEPLARSAIFLSRCDSLSD
jgi:hypothetical protein